MSNKEKEIMGLIYDVHQHLQSVLDTIGETDCGVVCEETLQHLNKVVDNLHEAQNNLYDAHTAQFYHTHKE